MTYRVAYLIRGRRTWADPSFETIDRASRYMNALKRRGLTAWIENSQGGFVPVRGARKKPGYLP